MKKTIKNAMSSLTAKLAALLLAFTCAGSAWGALSGSGTEADPFKIATLADLQEFRDAVNGGTTYAGQYVKLTADIDLSAVDNWTPIGDGTRKGAGNYFAGTFDGNSQTISGLKISSYGKGDDYAIGLFGLVKGGTVKDFAMTGVSITINSSSQYAVGSAVGAVHGSGLVSGVSVAGGSVTGGKGVGGVVGMVTNGGTVSGCSNAATVKALNYNAGGVVGSAYCTTATTAPAVVDCTNSGAVSGGTGAGGVVGLSSADVSGCSNTASVTGSGTSVGGVIGEQKSYGTVSGNSNTGAVVNNGGGYGTGGIIGWIRYQNDSSYVQCTRVSVLNNTNTGSVSGGNDAGGIVGTVYHTALVSGNTNKAQSLSGTGFAAGIVGNYQIGNVGAAYEPADNTDVITISGNTSETAAANITAGLTSNIVYDNSQGAHSIIVSNTPSNQDKANVVASATVNGVTTAYASLMEAINAAYNGGTVEVLADVTVEHWHQNIWTLVEEEGDFDTSPRQREPLVGPNNLTIHGNGHTLTVNAIDSAGNGNRLFSGAKNLNIDNYTIDVKKGAGIGMDSGTLDTVSIKTPNGNTLLPGANCTSAADYSADIAGVTVKNCTLDGGTGSPFYVNENGCAANFKISDSTLKSTSTGTIAILRGNEVLEDCTIKSPAGSKITLTNGGVAGPATITGNNFGETGLKIYSANNCEDATITGNVFSSASVIKRDGTDVVNLSENYWGDGSAPSFTDSQYVVVDSYYQNYDTATGTLSNLYEVPPVATVTINETTTKYTDLNKALTAAVTAGQDATVTICAENFENKTLDLSGSAWSPISLNANKGGNFVTVEGSGAILTGLSDMLFSGTWAGKTGLVIKDLTIKDSTIVHDAADAEGTVGVGAFIGFPQASETITLSNCHLVNSTVEGGHWTGGLIGIAAGYSGNDGPVFETVTITGCSVEDSTITGKGSAGGIIGHGAASDWTKVIITDTTVTGNTVKSTGSSGDKAGAVCGTVGAAGKEKTVNGVTHEGGIELSADVSNNTVTSGTTDKGGSILGRIGSDGGELAVTGGTYDGTATYADDTYDSSYGKIIISGGSFKTAPSADAVADGFVVTGTPNAEGYYTLEEAPKGTITVGYVNASRGVWGEADSNAKESFSVKVYSGETLLGTTTLNNIGGIIDGSVNVTWSALLPTVSDEYWTTVWEEDGLAWNKAPTKVELWVDGVKVAENVAQLNGPDGVNPVRWMDVEGVAPAPFVVVRDGATVDMFGTIAEAVAAAQAGDTIQATKTGTYTLPNLPKNVTIEGTVEGVVFSHLGAYGTSICNVSNGVTFKNVSFTFGNNDYHGWQEQGGVMVFDGCSFEGKFFSYGNMVFTNCNFHQNKDYHMWAYGPSTVEYTGCTFVNEQTSKFINVYREGSEPNVVKVSACKFINNGTASKAALNVKSTCGNTPLTADVIVDVKDCSTEGAFPTAETSDATGFIDAFIQIDDEKENVSDKVAVAEGTNIVLDENNKITGGIYKVIDDSLIAAGYLAVDNTDTATAANYPQTIGGPYDAIVLDENGALKQGYATLAAAIAAAQEGETVQLIADVELSATVEIPAEKNVVLDMNGKTVSVEAANVIKNNGTLAIQNGTLAITNAGSGKYYAILSEGDLTANAITINSTSGGIRVKGTGVTGTLTDCNITTETTVTTYAHGVYASDGANVTIKSGTYSYTGPVSQDTVQACDDGTVLTIEGGTFTAALDSQSTQNATPKVLNNNGSGAVVYVKGGTFNGDLGASNGDVLVSGGTFNINGLFSNKLAISGGYFSFEVTDAMCAAGYVPQAEKVTVDAVEYYTVQVEAGKVARNVEQNKAYASLADAFADAAAGETVQLIADISLTDRLFVNAGATPAYAGSNNRYATTSENKAITLDMNGKNITSASNIALAGGSLNITGEGNISTTGSGLAPIEVRGTGALANKRTLTIGADVTLNGDYGLNVFGSNDAQKNIIDVTVNGTVNGTLFVLGNLTNAENEIKIVVNGTVIAPNGTGTDVNVGIALNGNANVTVNNGATVSGDSGIEVRAGNLTVNGGTITATASEYSYNANGSGCTTKGAAIAVAQHGTALATAVTLNGGTLDGVKAIGVTDVNGNMDNVSVIATQGYTQSSAIPDDYKWVETTTAGKYTLAPMEYVAQVGTAKYESLAAAFAAAQNGDTVQLLADISLTDRLFVNAGATPAYAGSNNRYATTSEDKAITLDMNGKNITSASNIALAGGSLNITGTGKISTTTDGLAPIEVRGTGDLASKRTLTIGSGVTLDGGSYGLNVFGSNDAQKNLIDVTVNGTVNGTLFVLGNLKNTENAINIVVNGTVTAAAGTAEDVSVGIALNGNANVTVNAPASVSGDSGIEVRAGSLTVNGGTITGTASEYSYKANGSGCTTKGAAIAVAQYGKGLATAVTLNGGTLSGKKTIGVTDVNGNMDNVSVIATQGYTQSSAIPDGYKWVETETTGKYTLAPMEYVAQVGTAKYESLAEAFSAAQDGDTVTLLKNVELTDRLFVNAGATPAYAGSNNRYATTSENKAVTLGLNGFNITSESNIALAGGSLTITGKGKISTTNDGLAPIEVRGTGDLAAKRTLTIGSDVTLEGGEYGLNVFGSNDAQKNLIDVTVNGTVNGTLFVLGNLKNAENAINIVVNGKVAAPAGEGDNVNVGIALNGNAKVTVNNDATVSGDSGIEVRAGTLTVNGGTIKGTASEYSYKANGSGSTTKGAAIAVAQHGTALDTVVTLNGGTLEGVKTIGVTDVNGNMDNVEVLAKQGFTENSAIPDDYKWVETETSGVYELVPKDYVAQIGDDGEKFETLAEAFAAAQSGETVKLLKDIELTNRLFVNAGATPAYGGSNNRYATTSENKTLTLDMNDHDITGSSNIALAGGSLTITGTGKISTTTSGLAPIEVRGTGSLTSKRTLTIDTGVTLEGKCYGVNVFGSNNADKNVIDVNVNGTVKGMVFVLGNLTNSANEININVTGTVDASAATGEESVHTAIAQCGYSTVTVSDGAVVKGESGIETRAGTLTVNGGTITATEAYNYASNGSGTTTKGAAVAVAQYGADRVTSVTINNGTLSGEKKIAVTDVNNDMSKVKVFAKEADTTPTVIPEGYTWAESTEKPGMWTLVKKLASFTYPIEGTAGIPVDLKWLEDNLDGVTLPILETQTDDIIAALSEKGDNGIPVWQSYVLGLDPSDPDATLRLTAEPVANESTKVVVSAVINLANMPVIEGTTVSFRLAARNGDEWTTVESATPVTTLTSDGPNNNAPATAFIVPLDDVAGKVLAIFADIVTE